MDTWVVTDDDLLLAYAMDGCLGFAGELLEEGSPNINVTNGEGMTPLQLACNSGQLEMIRFLIEHGANLHIKDENGRTALFWACSPSSISNLRPEILQLLIEHGAQIVNDLCGNTPLCMVCGDVDGSEMAVLLIENGADINEYGVTMYKVNAGRVDEEMIWDSVTPLHRACQFGCMEVVQLLLSRGAVVDATTELGYTPLEQASEGNHLEVVWILVRQNPWLVSERLE